MFRLVNLNAEFIDFLMPLNTLFETPEVIYVVRNTLSSNIYLQIYYDNGRKGFVKFSDIFLAPKMNITNGVWSFQFVGHFATYKYYQL